MPQLDGLRAIAVIAVLVHHYVPGGLPEAANLGVKLFFVLSGFLITGILLSAGEAVERVRGSRIVALRNFYARRCLRIFPLYYFVVLVAVVLDVEPAREYAPSLLSYTLNLTMAAQGWFIEHFAHFWSLSIEEQFYLIWPWIVLLVPRRALIPAVAAMAALGPGYRLYLILGWEFFDLQTDGLASYIFTLTAFDSLGLGSLLALLTRGTTEQDRRITANVFLGAGLGITALLIVLNRYGNLRYANLLFFDLASASIFCWLITHAARGFGGIPGRALSWTPMRHVGKISYGVYVYHPLVPALLTAAAAMIGLEFQRYSWLGFGLASTVTLLVASASWSFMEKPLNDLKRFVP